MITPRHGETLRERAALRRGADPGPAPTPMRPPSRFAWLNPGWLTLASSVALALLGVATIALTTEGATATRQGVFLAIGLFVTGALILPHPKQFRAFAWPFAIVTALMLLFVLVPMVPEAIVRPRKGARRWINLGFTEFQPSELAKVAFVFLLASFLCDRESHRKLLGLVQPAVLAGVPMLLILVEPDLGTSLLFPPALVVMLIVAGAKLKHILGTCAIGAGFAAVIVGLSLAFAQREEYPLLRPHQVSRILAIIDIYKGDTRFQDDRTFQSMQAITIAGAGGVTGHDAERTQALIRFNPLPEKHNDMIFPVIVNRWGMVGGMAVILLYAVWIASALAVAWATKDPFGRLVATGFAAMTAAQAFVNIGMTLGLVPITGMTLPFVSYGGSSLIVGFMMVGVICGIGLRRPGRFWRESFSFED